jgi:hypothetical protein
MYCDRNWHQFRTRKRSRHGELADAEEFECVRMFLSTLESPEMGHRNACVLVRTHALYEMHDRPHAASALALVCIFSRAKRTCSRRFKEEGDVDEVPGVLRGAQSALCIIVTSITF